MTITALLVEDDRDLAEAISDFLAFDKIELDFAYNGQAGLSLATTEKYDVIITDLNMPKMDGITLCQRLRQQGITTPVLMLTARDSLQDKISGFNAGSDDYLVKPFAMEELLVRIQALSRRGQGHLARLEVAGLHMDLDGHHVSRAKQPLTITPSGFKLLHCLMQHSPNVVSRTQLERALWGDDHDGGDSLKVHLFKLRQAVDAPFKHKLIHTIHGVGVVLKAIAVNHQEPSDDQH